MLADMQGGAKVRSRQAMPGDAMAGRRCYPDYLLPVAGRADSVKDQADAAARQRYERFCRVREELLVDYGYNTARAYWGDLDDIYRWAEEHCKNVLALTDKDRKQYVALLRRRKYSENTVRRRKTALRLLMNVDAHRPEKDAL